MTRTEFLRGELAYLSGPARDDVASLPAWERARAETLRLRDIALINDELRGNGETT